MLELFITSERTFVVEWFQFLLILNYCQCITEWKLRNGWVQSFSEANGTAAGSQMFSVVGYYIFLGPEIIGDVIITEIMKLRYHIFFLSLLSLFLSPSLLSVCLSLSLSFLIDKDCRYIENSNSIHKGFLAPKPPPPRPSF